MQIVLHVERGTDGRLSGTVTADRRAVEFSGAMELLAAIERLAAPASPPPR
jgi:hypothetical protein